MQSVSVKRILADLILRGPEKGATATCLERAGQQKRFAVLGGRHEASSILQLFSLLGLDIVAHHDDCSGRDPIGDLGGIPPVGKTEFSQLLTADNVELLVASTHVADGTDQFLEACRYAREELGYEGRILHPSALCDVFQYPGTRYLLVGISGSGNMVFQSILDSFLQREQSKPVLERDAVGWRLASFALNHLESIRRLFSEHIGDITPQEVLASGTHVNFGQCLVRKEDQYCSLSGLPLKRYAWDGRWTSSHEPIKAVTADFYEKQGYDIVYILRHPLDVIVSNAAKIASTLPGTRRPGLALNNRQWFSDIVQTVCRHYEALGAQRARLKFVRYESLMSDPAEEIARLAGYLGVQVTERERIDLWKKLEGVPVAGEWHFWDPRAGKWKEQLGPMHRDIVLASGLPELAHEFGYEIDPAGFVETAANSDAADGLEKASLERLAWIDAILEIPIGKPASLSGELVRLEEKELGLVGFFDTRHAERGRALMNAPELKLLVESAWWDRRGQVPSTVRAYLGL